MIKISPILGTRISTGACPERNAKIPRFARNDRSEGVEMTCGLTITAYVI